MKYRALLWALIPLFLCAATASLDIHVTVTAVQQGETVFGNNGAPWPFFNRVPAVNYDNGGQNAGYNVPAPGCQGATCASGASTYRADDVNFKASTFAGIAYQLGFSAIPNSYNYQINISQAGPYKISLWLGDNSTGGSWGILIDGTLVTTVSTPNTGDFGILQQATSGNFTVATGNHKLELLCNGSDINFNGCGDIVAWQGAIGSGGGNIACDIGPNYIGTTPAGLPAGWICAFNSDFTLAGGFDATLSNWLDVCGAGSPKWYSTPTNGGGNAADCSRYGIVADGANPQVLHITFLASDPGISRWGTTLTTTNANLSAGQTFPLGAYWQATYRVPASTYATVPGGNGFPIVWAWWSWESPQNNVLEWDFIESYADSTSACGGPVTQNCGNAATWHDHQSGGGAQTYVDYRRTIDPTVYNIYGTRITQDGTNVVGCSYINNVLAPGQAGQGTGTGCSSPFAPAQTTNRQYPILMLGPQGSPTYTPTGTQDAYVKQVTVFACPTWRTTQCPTALLMGPP